LGKAGGLDLFLDDPHGSPREAVHIVFANEKVLPDSPVAAPDVSEAERADQFQLVTLDALVRMKLAAHRDKDRTHLRDLIEVGLIDRSALAKLPDVLQSRLQQILESPEG
jgi:hypothetical protein